MRTVAAVIVTYNNEAMLERLLRDLSGQRALLHEVYVVDNSLNGRTEGLVARDFPNVRYIGLHPNKGSAGGYYEGIKRASEANELVWLLDDDVSVPADSLENLLKGLEGLEQKNRIGAVRSWCNSRCLFSRTISYIAMIRNTPCALPQPVIRCTGSRTAWFWNSGSVIKKSFVSWASIPGCMRTRLNCITHSGIRSACI